MQNLGIKAKQASRALAVAETSEKNKALEAIAAAILEQKDYILTENLKDVRNARMNKMNESLVDRLVLSEERIESMAQGVLQIAAQDDPINRIVGGSTRPNGLKIRKVTVPLGVIAVIYEARPNVTVDSAALCLKAGNAVILRGGKEAICSNKALALIMRKALSETDIPEDAVQLVENTERESAYELMKANEFVDVLIPRGGAGLIKSCVENATVPVIETGTGNCHVYVDEYADLKMAKNIIINAKTSRPSVCNACESLVIHSNIADEAVPLICDALREKGVRIKGDEKVCSLVPYASPAEEEDWGKEYLDYIISVKTADSIDEAIDHISKYGTGHSECIVTDNYRNANIFTSCVDAAAVYVNASTRFTDGGEFGFGAEIGISTQKLHARGPLGLGDLTSFKYILTGDGQVR